MLVPATFYLAFHIRMYRYIAMHGSNSTFVYTKYKDNR